MKLKQILGSMELKKETSQDQYPYVFMYFREMIEGTS